MNCDGVFENPITIQLASRTWNYDGATPLTNRKWREKWRVLPAPNPKKTSQVPSPISKPSDPCFHISSYLAMISLETALLRCGRRWSHKQVASIKARWLSTSIWAAFWHRAEQPEFEEVFHIEITLKYMTNQLSNNTNHKAQHPAFNLELKSFRTARLKSLCTRWKYSMQASLVTVMMAGHTSFPLYFADSPLSGPGTKWPSAMISYGKPATQIFRLMKKHFWKTYADLQVLSSEAASKMKVHFFFCGHVSSVKPNPKRVRLGPWLSGRQIRNHKAFVMGTTSQKEFHPMRW